MNAPLPIGLLFRFMTSIPSQETAKPRRPVVSALLRRKGRILILRRSDKVGSFQGFWSCVSGYVERREDPLDTAIREIEEEVGIPSDRASLVRRCGPNLAETEEVIFESHWFLFDCDQKGNPTGLGTRGIRLGGPVRTGGLQTGPLVRGFAHSVNGRRLTEGPYSSDPA